MRVVSAACAVTLVLSACTGEPQPPPDPAVLIVAGRQVDFVHELTAGFEAGVRRVPGIGWGTTGPEIVDSAAQLRVFQDFVEGRYGSVTLFTFAPELFADSLERAAAAGTPVVELNSIPAPGSRVPLYVGNDNLEIGEQLGRAVAGHIPAGATGMVILGSPFPGVTVLDERATGVREAVRRLRPEVTVLGPFDTKQDPVANMEAWRTLQAANPGALAFVGVGGADAHSLALLDDPDDDRVDGGVGTAATALAATGRGAMVLVSSEPYLQGLLAGAIQARTAKDHGELPVGWLPVPGIVVDRGNVALIVARQQNPENRAAWFRDAADRILADVDDHLRPMDDAR
ncbi:sugar ABC transporter substrate-binding protein [Actinoplanes sp. G11-F43]|uniref:sugar ABC transporter substrate-binding protein n=1 Tax=Actinoplanes sp. G11-F43 TaxID=3424130 RepID=UPI003D32D79D